MMERDYDVVIYGATGFVGSRAAEYLAGHAQRDKLRWALAGRDRQKLEAIKARLAGMVVADLLVADSADQFAVDAVVARTRVLLNVAGPFALYGDAIVDACVRLRTHYVDITGETVWVKSLIDRYHDRAAAAGTRVIPFCGFDSVPSDLGSYLLVRHLRRTFDVGCTEVKAYFQMYGGFMSLALNADALPGGQARGGVLTPATGLGEVLTERLRNAGVAIEVGS